jgi:hypothetical protein
VGHKGGKSIPLAERASNRIVEGVFVLLVGTAIREGIAAFAGIGGFPSIYIRSPDMQAIDCAGVCLMEGLAISAR